MKIIFTIPCIFWLCACATNMLDSHGRIIVPHEYVNVPDAPYQFAIAPLMTKYCGAGRNGCAIIESGKCAILIKDSLRFLPDELKYVIHHESAHCAGWRHA